MIDDELAEIHLAHMVAFRLLVWVLHELDIIEKSSVSTALRGVAEDVERQTPGLRESLKSALNSIAESIDREAPPNGSWVRGAIEGGKSDGDPELDQSRGPLVERPRLALLGHEFPRLTKFRVALDEPSVGLWWSGALHARSPCRQKVTENVVRKTTSLSRAIPSSSS